MRLDRCLHSMESVAFSAPLTANQNMLRSIIAPAFLAFCLLQTSLCDAQEISERLQGGEFSAARDVAFRLPPAGRDSYLAQIASAQGSVGESVAAAGTIRGIGNPNDREQAINGAGGGAFADFQSLIDLIQTTVVPDTWEALGGPSTMAPYPQGVFVDASGTVLECESFAKADAVSELKSLLAPKTPDAITDDQAFGWRRPARMRCVSLRRLSDELTRLRIDAAAMPEAMTHMAGLSRIQYLFIEKDDVIIAGPVAGIDNVNGWFRDRDQGLNTLRLDFFLTCLASAIGNQPFGCTIDPTTEGLQAAAAVSAKVTQDEIPIGKAADAMTDALGMQRVEVFGTAGDTPIGYVMVEADRHMKQLALGIEPMPEGVPNYLDAIDATIDRGAPSELLLRLWFTASPASVRADEDRTVFEIAGTPIRLSGQNERALASGERGHVTEDIRTAAFVGEFNSHWDEIRTKYPIYASLESIYRAASVSELCRKFGDSPEQQNLLVSLASHASSLPRMEATPRQVLSIAKLHSVRHGRKIHHVLLASGGVSVDAKQTLVSKVADYPSLRSLPRPPKTQPRLIQRWWWDVR